MRVPWTAGRSNQSILKEINPEYSLEGLMLKLKLQYFGHLMRRADSLEKTLMLGWIGGRRRTGGQRMRWLDSIIDSMNVGLSKLGVSEGQGSLVCCSAWGRKESDTTERLNNNNNILKTGKGSTPVITIKTSKTTFKKYYELPFATLLGVANRL